MDAESSLLTSIGEGRSRKVLSLLVQVVPQQDSGLDRTLVATGGGRCRNTLKAVGDLQSWADQTWMGRSRWHSRASQAQPL